jgi:hypothetical protein
MPETYKPEKDMPDGIADTTARQELRRISKFLPGREMSSSKLKPYRRETIWMQLIEGMHWKEADILIHIKDQTLLNIYPDLEKVLLSAFGIVTCINKTKEGIGVGNESGLAGGTHPNAKSKTKRDSPRKT